MRINFGENPDFICGLFALELEIMKNAEGIRDEIRDVP
jgi:hypothetical protein